MSTRADAISACEATVQRTEAAHSAAIAALEVARQLPAESTLPPVVTPPPTPPVPPPVIDPSDPAAYTIPPEAKTLPAGSTLVGLAPGHYVLEGGDYSTNGGAIAGVHLYAATPRTVTLRAKGQLFVTGGGLYGIMGKGGGKAEKLNDNAALVLKDKAKFINGGWSDALGVALAGDGKEVAVIGAWLHNNGSAGIGGKLDDSLVAYCWCKGNNVKVKDRDGAAMGKFTRSNRSAIRFNKIEDGTFAGIWYDINNGPCEITDNTILRIAKLKEDYEGVGIKLEINAPGFLITRNHIEGQYGPAVVVNETQKVRITNNTLFNGTGPDRAVLHLRQLTRDDEAQKAVKPGDWQLRDVEFSGNTFPEGEGIVTRSGAGTKLTLKHLKEWNVVLGEQKPGSRLNVKIPA